MSEKIEPRIDPGVVVKYLNELLEADNEAIKSLVQHRVKTNDKMMEHPSICVMCDSDENGNPINPVVGLLGVINGLVGLGQNGWHYIAAEFDEDGNLHRFLETPQAVDPAEEEE